MSEARQLQCLECGRTAPPNGNWASGTHPTLGSMTKCPECGSTNVQTKR
ncbi:hypothetical protein [Halobacterium noricense]|nr:hypothetical protein [Halobacterium noricense]UHH24848.1 hypothetical protein LT974_12775 [Halobacterium noricense]